MGALLLIGTRKGLLVAQSRDRRAHWDVGALQLRMSAVLATAVDLRRSPPRLIATGTHAHWGPALLYSDDLGDTWTEPDATPLGFPRAAGAALARVWQVEPSSTREPDVVYAGTEPAALFRSEDRGMTFRLVEGLWDHPHRPTWQPVNAGQFLHTIVVDDEDPRRVLVGMSAGGVYRTADGGESWEPCNRGLQLDNAPPELRFPEYGQCVHKVARAPGRPGRLYAQGHPGVYRSDNGGDCWTSIGDGLPSDFGFPLVVHARRPDTAYVFPLAGDVSDRMPPDGRCRVYRTDDAGSTWRAMSQGLPPAGHHAAVLRDGMCGDGGDPLGLYLGTRDGEVYASRDEGESWSLVARHLPDVLCVRAAVL